MPRFFVPSDKIIGKSIIIDGSDALHIRKSLRMREGESLTVCDMHLHEHVCVIRSFELDAVNLEIVETMSVSCEPPYHVKLFQALPKSDKMDLIVQKSVECGACEIIPFISERCISRPDKKSAANKLERWNKIALEAAKQCGRGIVPNVREICSFKEALDEMSGCELPVLFYEGDDTESVKTVLSCETPKTVALMIGAEGGFSQNEVAFAREVEKIKIAGLGKRILRCETAPIFALGALAYALEL